MQHRLSRRASIWVVGAQIMLMFTLPTLPTPLYVKYTQQFHFSSLMLTVIFAAYTIGTLSTLFFLGRLSDQAGRRRVSLIAIGLAIAAALIFIFIKDTAMLFVARVVTGLATGLASGTAIAWMRDLHGPNGQQSASQRTVALNIFGLGLGPLLSGILAAFAPLPTVLTYVVFISLAILLAVGVGFAQETVQAHPQLKDVSLEPRIGVPRDLWSKFAAPAITIFASFSLVGFYSVIAPSMLAKTLHMQSLATIGSVVFGLFLFGAIASYLSFKLPSRTAMLTGIFMMLPALSFLVVSQQTRSFIALLIGTVFGGLSIGLSYRGALEIINKIAPPQRRAEMVSSLFVVGNLSLAIPVIGIGVLAALTSQPTANITFAVVVGIISIVGLFLGRRILYS